MASADVQMISKVFMDADIFGPEAAPSESVRSMLVAALPHAEGGHDYQKEVLRQCHGILSETKKLADSESTQLGEEAAAAAGRIAEAEQALITAAVATEQAQEAVQSATAELEQQEQTVATAKADEASSRKSESKHAQARDKCLAAKAALDSALSVLKVDHLEETQQELLEVLSQAGAEKPLLEAVPAALSVPSDTRGEFDKLTIDMAIEALTEYSTVLTEPLAEAEVAVRDATAEALGCEALREVEEEKREACGLNLQAAVNSAEARKAEEEEAKTTVSAREAERSDFLVRQVLAQDRARKVSEAMAAVDRLISPPPAPTAEDVEMAQESEEVKTAAEPSKEVDAPMGDVIRHATELGA